jgi:hypothetical protein
MFPCWVYRLQLSYQFRIGPRVASCPASCGGVPGELKLRGIPQLTIRYFRVKYRLQAEVAELADALRSGRSSHYGSVGSTPTFGTKTPSQAMVFFYASLN